MQIQINVISYHVKVTFSQVSIEPKLDDYVAILRVQTY